MQFISFYFIFLLIIDNGFELLCECMRMWVFVICACISVCLLQQWNNRQQPYYRSFQMSRSFVRILKRKVK